MDELIDERDENHYKIIKIGNLYWFAENLKYQGVLHYAPNNDTDNIDKYGCLYDWDNAKKACPNDWRLPTNKEFEKLLELTNAKADSSSIRSGSWENGNNSSGFNSLPAGSRGYYGDFRSFGSYAYFWSSSPYGDDYAYYLRVSSGNARVYGSYRSYAFSVRCVKSI